MTIRREFNARKIVRACGVLLSALALVWIVMRFTQSGAMGLLARAPIAPALLALMLAGAAVVYALVLSLLALAWWRLTSALSATQPPPRPIMATWAATQYGKYLPGNVAHYALRHAWSRRYGLSHAGLGLASILEAAFLLIAALGLTLLADTRELRGLSMLDPRLAITLLVAMIVALGVALHFARRRAFLEHWHVPALPPTASIGRRSSCFTKALFASRRVSARSSVAPLRWRNPASRRRRSGHSRKSPPRAFPIISPTGLPARTCCNSSAAWPMPAEPTRAPPVSPTIQLYALIFSSDPPRTLNTPFEDKP